jgi:hypothetical protein
MPYYKVKMLIEEEYIVKTESVETGPEVAKFLAGSKGFSKVISRSIKKKKVLLIENPLDHSDEKRERIVFKSGEPDYGDLFTMDAFKKEVSRGYIMDYDGTGSYSDGEYIYHDILTVCELDERYTHVMWYNK